MDIGTLVLDLFNFSKENYMLILQWIGLIFILTYTVVVFWVVTDVNKRTTNPYSKIISFITVTFFSVPGLITYLLFRPHLTIEEQKESRLYNKKDIILIEQNLKYCKNCFNLNKKEYRYCTECGSNMDFECTKCFVSVDPTWKFCPYCNSEIKLPVPEKFIDRVAGLIRRRVFAAKDSIVRKLENIQKEKNENKQKVEEDKKKNNDHK